MRTPVEVLLAMDEYEGAQDQFKAESVMLLCTSLGMREPDAWDTLEDLIGSKAIKEALTPGDRKYHGRWKWARG